MKVTVRIDNQNYDVEVGDLNERPITATIGDDTFEVWPEEQENAPSVALPRVQTALSTMTTPAVGNTRPAAASPSVTSSMSGSNAAASLRSTSTLVAPIPGIIVAIQVKAGETVKAGQPLCTLEAMKMKSAIRAPRDGKIDNVLVTIGEHVKHRQPLMEYAEA